jgi:uncharacterized protein (DUF924 family)
MQEQILAFWFGEIPGNERPEWFRKDDSFDARIRERFGPAVEAALDGAYGDWDLTARGSLARVLLLDQFTRNAFRDTPRAFAGDPQALATAQNAIARGLDGELLPLERWFLYMPFQHSEDRSVQKQSIEVFSRLAAETGLAPPLDWARRHAAIIERFGRFPHRNAILGRVPTPEEEAFLRTPGSRF